MEVNHIYVYGIAKNNQKNKQAVEDVKKMIITLLYINVTIKYLI